MKSSLTKDLKKALDLVDEMLKDIRTDCDNSMELTFREAMGETLTREEKMECCRAVVDIEARIYFHDLLQKAIRDTMDRHYKEEKRV